MLRVSSSIVMLCISFLFAFPALAAETENSGNASPWLISSGACTNLPPGSLAAIAVALERGIQVIKLDLVLSKDDQVMISSDPRLNDITNIDHVYPDRMREDGSYYSVDFTRAELKELTHRTGTASESAADAVTVFIPEFPIISLDEALGCIDLIQTDALHKPVVIGELRKGWLHRREGKDLAQAVYRLLKDYQVRQGRATLFLASYDPQELQQLGETRSSANDAPRLIQLIATNDGTEVQTLDFGQYQPYNYDLLFTKFGLKAISTYAAAIGLKPQTIIDESGTVIHPDYLEDARTLGMKLILYGEAADVQANTTADSSPSSVLDYLFNSIGFDAVLTDDNDLLSSWKQPRGEDAGGDDRDNTIDRLIKQIESGSTQQPSSSQSGTTW